ncbi:MAG: mandelate racemase/muconate lactonizing enzyme family protein [Pigmentiphaga sp.]|uniref:mandelate racemase/muconate lactonizing enzyme family protein n=1 Tax=Pigmentiphaga sp. TaxID=1977564 RepID=UPI0029B16466|nr:mandelate racemase/muconate lactonizing enzyme family protein [Pigmentiphaga sp.]MDX3906321.1 mandelate racemase/muconate lactonizing enzyme family protein [Pigmentiphaga sp.]
MKIARIETFHADGGYRVCSYLKLTTDDGLVGWSEFYDGLSGAELAPLIHGFARTALGMDPRATGLLSESLLATTRLAQGGLSHQAIAAIENACLDVHAKSLGIPVYRLFGGPFRDRVPVYWTHCGSFRVRHAAFYQSLGYEPVRSLEDFTRLGREAAAAGFRALKTNAVFFEPHGPVMMNAGFRIQPNFLDRSISERQIDAVIDQLQAFRAGVGPDFGLMLDVGFSQRTEGFVRLARRLEPLNLFWLELDTADEEALAIVRQSSRTPIASLESLHGLSSYRPFIARRTVDVAIVDPVWNGVWQSVRIATLADAFDTHIAPHNPVGDLATLMSAHLCAAVPNVRIMELRYDEAPWTHGFLTHPLQIDEGCVRVPERPGWGTDIDEEALRAHPVKTH